MSERHDERDADWPLRPWIMAGAGAAGGLMVHILTGGLTYDPVPTTGTILRQSMAAGIGIATVTFLITAERRRLGWAAGFAAAWGLIMGLVGYSTGAYNRAGELVEFPFLSGLLAIAVASPLFQTLRDEGRKALPYEKVHRYAWTDAIIGGASLAFTGLTFLLTFLLAMLFDAIGISVLKDLLDEGWFGWMLAGAAFGSASAVLREKDPLLGTLQRLVMLVFSVLAPVLAGALAIYLVALPTTGFAGLWKSGLPETPLLLSTAAFAVLFLNAIIGDSPDDRSGGKLWRATEAVLLLAVLPLGVLALVSMSMRVGQYGWTPERLWGVIACLIAIAYGTSAWAAAIRKRGSFDVQLRESQKWLALGVCGLALFLALPILDFGAISTRSQLARLEAGKVAANEFDWAALKYDFGPAGLAALKRYAASGSGEERTLASSTLRLDNRYDVERAVAADKRAETLETYVEVATPDIVLTDGLRRNIANMRECGKYMQCKLFRLDEHRLVLLTVNNLTNGLDRLILDERKFDGVAEKTYPQPDAAGIDMARVTIEVRDVPTKQVFVDGEPVGDPFE